MLKFDSSLLALEIVSLKSVTMAAGGSISVIDEALSTDEKEVLKRIPVPLAVARSFLVATKKLTRYFNPVLVAVVRYGDAVVALERHPLSSLGQLVSRPDDGADHEWNPTCWAQLHTHVLNHTSTSAQPWYFDGRYVYRLDADSVGSAVRSAEYLTRDGQFRKVVVKAIDLQVLGSAEEGALDAKDRTCLAFVTSTGGGAVSPPIWKNLSMVGQSAMKAAARDDDDDTDEDDEGDGPAEPTFSFEGIDDVLAVNLNFALKAGNEIGRTFGYEFVEPLQLPRLMIELRTVNLPSVSKEVKSMYDINIQFTHTFAWLLGMSQKANNLETLVMMRSLMKYLSKRGVYRKNVFDPDRVFVSGATVADVPLIDAASLRNDLADVATNPFGFSELLQRTRTGIEARKHNALEMHHLGDMVTEE